MKKHSNLTIDRIEKFRKKLKYNYYYDPVPMKAYYHKTKEPISYDLAQTAIYDVIQPGKKWGSLYECAWFKFQGRVPDEFAGKEVVALIDVGGEGCVFDKGGNPIQGLTNKRIEWTMKETIIKKRVCLFKEAKGGEKVDLMVDAGANNILGAENVLTYESMEDGVFNQAELAIFDREKWKLFVEFDLLANLMTELYEKTRHRKLLIYALNEVVNKYGDGGPEEVAICRGILKEELDKKANASAIEASAIGHAHIDIAWLWPLRETVRKAARTFSTALLLMDEYPEYKFGASQPVLYQMMKDNYPGLYQRMKDAIKRQQWECQGAMWVEADCNLTSGESLVRQIIHGKKFFQDEFDVEVDNLWLPDVFGYSAALPQLLKKSDVNYFMTQKISWNQFNTFPHHTFIWKGLDGTEIFSHFLAPNNYRSDVSSADLINLERENYDTERNPYALFLYGAGDGGGGPSRIYLEKLLRTKDLEDLPKVKLEFARDFFIKAERDSRDLQKWNGELYLELHRGTLTTHALTKKLNRKLELMLREVEYIYSIYDLENYPQEDLDRLWKVVLLNQFHDIIPGTSISQVHVECLAEYKAAMLELKDFLQKAHEKMSANISNPTFEKAIAATNSLSWERKTLLELPENTPLENIADPQGNILKSQPIEVNGKNSLLVEVTVPPIGHSVIGESAGKSKKENTGLKVTDTLLENDLIKVQFNKIDGTISKIWDKEIGRDVLLPGESGNKFKLFQDIPNLWDAWDVDIFYDETTTSAPKITEIKVKESGPVRGAISFSYIAHNYSIEQTVYLSYNSKRIDFKTHVNWHETDHMLRVEFPVNILAREATFEIQYGHVKRPTHYNTSWDMAQFEVVAHKWADISQPNYGVALLNDCKYGHKIKGNIISLNLLRSPKNPDPLADMHEHDFTYSLLPHIGDHITGNVIHEAYELNIPVRVIPLTKNENGLASEKSFVHVEQKNIIVEAIKKAEYSDDRVVRLYEGAGIDGKATIEVGFEFKEVWLVNLMERDIEKLTLKKGKIELSFGPMEIHTLLFK
ncbi:alpha-mannosidase [Flexithrix dorotheae]|uniref:alpha-mannosidase n=1 Tax=Flexithrix dorotheae TaxID=70993 RepID=UPI00037D7C44|nr:glycoside hydrolase family 38 C-terminal domain-containing protein [Flexithrix dorotheae]